MHACHALTVYTYINFIKNLIPCIGHGPFSHMFDYKVIKELSEGSKEHEELSVDIFKHMLANNPKVLSEFVDADLTADHVTLIGEMINPPEQSNRQDQKRTFLYEVNSQAKNNLGYYLFLASKIQVITSFNLIIILT